MDQFTAPSQRLGHEGTEAAAKALARFSKGGNINQPALKAKLWNYYVHTGLIVDSFSDEVNSFVQSSNVFFRGELISGNIKFMRGLYFAYKKSIFNPSKTVTKYLVRIQESIISQSIMHIGEVHYNRSKITTDDDPIREDWSGVMLLRKTSIFCVLREDRFGTPRTLVFSNPPNIPDSEKNNNEIIYLFGDQIECVEKWGRDQVNISPILFEKVINDRKEEDLLLECDLIDRNIIKRKHPHVWQHLYGGRK